MEGDSTVYLNATIHTMDGSNPRAEALWVRGERIAAVGTRQDVLDAAHGARTVDLDGRSIVPGFNDSHAHILELGLSLTRVDVSPDRVRTIADVQQAVAGHVGRRSAGEWVLGRGYDQTALVEMRHPTRTDLDAVSPENPVALWHTSGHVLVCNSRALEIAGITRNTDDPFGGEIDRDEHGEPTGVLKESAMDAIGDCVPEPSKAEGTEAVLQAMELMATQGITSASDAATGQGPSADPEIAMYRAALESGRLTGRITLMPQVYYVAPPNDGGVRNVREFDTGNAPEWLAIGPLKIFSDGALSTRTAAMRDPYEGTSSTGILLWDTPVLEEMIARAHAAGWQIATHALGDRAIVTVLDCYEKALAAHPRADHRHRIEHCMYIDDGIADRIKRLGVVPSLQPDIYRLGDAYISALGLERACTSIPMAIFKRHGITVAFSSDRPVIPGHPLEVVRSAIERVTPRGVSLGQEHAVTAMEAIRNYTWGGAYATHTEHLKGSLRPGLLADFAALSADPEATPPEEFASLRVTMTVTGGVVRYEE